jgi:glycogen operon protein
VKWLTPAGSEMAEQDWNFPDGRFLAYDIAGAGDSPAPLYVVLNGAEEAMEVTLPEWPETGRWMLLIDTANGESDGNTQPAGTKWQARPRSVLVFAGAK